MILSTIPGSRLPALATLAAFGPFEPGTAGHRATVRAAAVAGMVHVSAMIRAGRTPADVAAYVLAMGPGSVAVSHAIEDAAHPGTFAEAVFSILAD